MTGTQSNSCSVQIYLGSRDLLWKKIAGYNLVNNSNSSIFFYGPRYHPLVHIPFKYYHQNSSQRGDITSQKWLFCPRDILWNVLALLYQDLPSFYRIFEGLKSSKKDKSMMSCTRIYVEPTDSMMIQESKRRLIILLMGLLENMRWHNWSNIIANTEETKISLIGPLFWTLGKLPGPF